MRLKIFRAANMAEAMGQMRSELGPDALILGARTLREGVEVTAAAEPAATPVRPAPQWQPAPLQLERPLAAVVAFHGIAPALAARMAGGNLAAGLSRALRFAPLDVNGGPLLFVGPPGAGKTSSVARLATRLVLGGQRPLVITADGRRAGATEQLAAYTRLLGINLVVASQAKALVRAMARREGGAPVLIDAPGSSWQDPAELQELCELAHAVDARAVLVLPAGLDATEAVEAAEAYASAGAGLMVANRLDLARRLGSVLGAAAAAELTLTEAGIGPGAADGLVRLTAAFLAARLQRGVPGGTEAGEGRRA